MAFGRKLADFLGSTIGKGLLSMLGISGSQAGNGRFVESLLDSLGFSTSRGNVVDSLVKAAGGTSRGRSRGGIGGMLGLSPRKGKQFARDLIGALQEDAAATPSKAPPYSGPGVRPWTDLLDDEEETPQTQLSPAGGSGRGGLGGKKKTTSPGGRGGKPHNYPEVFCHASTNVYSFYFEPDSSGRKGTLFVRYKAPAINSKAVRYGTGAHNGKEQLIGKLGSTVRGKTDSPGTLYAYYDVPTRFYHDLVRVKDRGGEKGPGIKSPGTFIWDQLRERGTVFGHKFRYQLVEGASVPGMKHQYVPRRATPTGFRTRSLAEPGIGRRGFVSSTLAEQKGHRTFSSRKRT